MTIARTGTYTEDVDLGFFEYGNGAAGGLTVSERSTLIQSATSDYVDTIFGLGENGIGTLTVNDNGRFELLAPISERALFVGMFGATGSASVADKTRYFSSLTEEIAYMTTKNANISVMKSA